jgi:hypothetical protein
MTDAGLSLGGGLLVGRRWFGYSVTPPLVRLVLTGDGVSIRPRWWWLGLFIPTLEFAWDQVVAVAGSSDPMGAWPGMRFVLAAAPSVERGWLLGGPWLWRRLVRQPMVLLTQGSMLRALSALPGSIPRSGFERFGPGPPG